MATKNGKPGESKRGMENHEYFVMMRRMIRRYGERVAESDWTDLEEMLTLRAQLDDAIHTAVKGQRASGGFSWTDIGRGLGITRQAAQQRFGRD